ncbi:hypothetical protein SNARM312S_03969 [Streptomyces narbonensis]
MAWGFSVPLPCGGGSKSWADTMETGLGGSGFSSTVGDVAGVLGVASLARSRSAICQLPRPRAAIRRAETAHFRAVPVRL